MSEDAAQLHADTHSAHVKGLLALKRGLEMQSSALERATKRAAVNPSRDPFAHLPPDFMNDDEDDSMGDNSMGNCDDNGHAPLAPNAVLPTHAYVVPVAAAVNMGQFAYRLAALQTSKLANTMLVCTPSDVHALLSGLATEVSHSLELFEIYALPCMNAHFVLLGDGSVCYAPQQSPAGEQLQWVQLTCSELSAPFMLCNYDHDSVNLDILDWWVAHPKARHVDPNGPPLGVSASGDIIVCADMLQCVTGGVAQLPLLPPFAGAIEYDREFECLRNAFNERKVELFGGRGSQVCSFKAGERLGHRFFGVVEAFPINAHKATKFYFTLPTLDCLVCLMCELPWYRNYYETMRDADARYFALDFEIEPSKLAIVKWESLPTDASMETIGAEVVEQCFREFFDVDLPETNSALFASVDAKASMHQVFTARGFGSLADEDAFSLYVSGRVGVQTGEKDGKPVKCEPRKMIRGQAIQSFFSERNANDTPEFRAKCDIFKELFDSGVYTKNRIWRMAFSTKKNGNRYLLPMTMKGATSLEASVTASHPIGAVLKQNARSSVAAGTPLWDMETAKSDIKQHFLSVVQPVGGVYPHHDRPRVAHHPGSSRPPKGNSIVTRASASSSAARHGVVCEHVKSLKQFDGKPQYAVLSGHPMVSHHCSLTSLE
jgi:hypothetical protein